MSDQNGDKPKHHLENKLVIAVSSRALFDFEEENKIFEGQGIEAYKQHQLDHVSEAARQGVAFSLVQKLLSLNEKEDLVEVVILSRNDPASGLRVFNSTKHYNLNITRGAFVAGSDPYVYLKAFRANLFLSASEEDVRAALAQGVPAGRIIRGRAGYDDPKPKQLRIAFDGDAVLFDDQSEQIYQKEGLSAFQQYEDDNKDLPHAPGPFKPFLDVLHQLRSNFPKEGRRIRVALVTARNAPSHERAIRTLMKWGVDVDEAFFLGGLPKAEFLEQFHPDFFFDDQTKHCDLAAPLVPTAHVPFGVMNKLLAAGATSGGREEFSGLPTDEG